jgi:hypothetical protein
VTDDEIAAVFADVTMEDFITIVTTASAVLQVDGPGTGLLAFELFAREMREETVRRYRDAAHGMTPFGVLQTESEQRWFDAEPDEKAGDFYARLHVEAQTMEADWFATGLLAPIAVGHPFPGADGPAVEAHLEAGTLSVALIAFAEARRAPEAQVRLTLWPTPAGTGDPGPHLTGDLHDGTPLLRSVLAGVR